MTFPHSLRSRAHLLQWRFHKIKDHTAGQDDPRFSVASSQSATQNHDWTCWNPGNALPLQDRSVEVWPRRENLQPASRHGGLPREPSARGEFL